MRTVRGARIRIRVGAVLSTTLVATALLAGCTGAGTAQSAPQGGKAAMDGKGVRIAVVAPTEAVRLGDEIDLIVRITEDGRPIAPRSATFEVVSGPGSYPGGFESSSTDSDGIATSLAMQATAAGPVVVRVAAGQVSADVTVTIAGS